MIVIGHQAIGVTDPIPTCDHLPENFEKKLAVGILFINRVVAQ